MPALTHLEHRLAQLEGGVLRDQLLGSLAQTESRLRSSRMLPPSEYLQVSALTEAVQAAQEVLGMFPVGTAQSSKVSGPAEVRRS